MVVDPLKEQVDDFLSQSAVQESSNSNTASGKSWNSAQQANFHESYKYNPDTATFSLNEMTAIMCTILFPLYLGSEEYQHWKAWHVAKSRKINGPYMAAASGEIDMPNGALSEEGTGTVDVEHLQHMLLSIAAFLDQAEIQNHFTRPNLFEDARTALFSSSFGICICSAQAPQAASADQHPVLYINQAFEQMTGFTLKTLSKGLFSLHGAETEKQQIERINTAVRERSSLRLVLTLHRRNRAKFLAAMAVKPSFDNTGEIVYWIALYFDLSARNKRRSLGELKRIDDLLALIPNLLHYPPATATESL